MTAYDEMVIPGNEGAAKNRHPFAGLPELRG